MLVGCVVTYINYIKKTSTNRTFEDILSNYFFNKTKFLMLSMHYSRPVLDRVLITSYTFMYQSTRYHAEMHKPCNNLGIKKYEMLFTDMYQDDWEYNI